MDGQQTGLLKLFQKLIRMGKLWSIGIFEQPFNPYQFSLDNLIATFNSKRVRTRKRHTHTYADPFLIAHKDKLYLFAEAQEINGKGYINLWESDDAKEWKDVGVVLKDDFHFSYPFVFKDAIDGEFYLIPESGQAREIALYGFEEFPFGVQKKCIILKGEFADSSLVKVDQVYYLSTTNLQTGNYELYYSKKLMGGEWVRHPSSPIQYDKSMNRNGGGFIQVNNTIFRIAQNSEKGYGGGIVILEVNKIDEQHYSESIVYKDTNNELKFDWQKNGRHHLSIASFKGRTIIACDGLQYDYWVNKLTGIYFKLVKR